MSRLMRAVLVTKETNKWRMVIGQTPLPVMRPNDVMVKVAATALNRADLLQKRGLYPPPKGETDIMGLEAVGYVEDVGPACSKGFRKGDRVMGLLPGGGYAEYLSANENLLCRIPEGLDMIQAATIPEVFMTAHQLMSFVTKCTTGDRILIHAAGSGVGIAALQIAKLFGLRSYATVRSSEKVSKIKADVVIDCGKNGDFDKIVLEDSNGHGADVILDCVGGSYSARNVNCLATDGRLVVYGFLGGTKIDDNLLLKLFQKRGQLLTSTLRTRSIEYKKKLVDSFESELLPHFVTSPYHLAPALDRVFPWQQVEEAHQLMETNQTCGKIVLKIE